MTVLINDYLASLPNGADSYPNVETKASGFTNFFEGYVDAIVPALPESIRPVILHAPPPSSWIPEVHMVAACLVLRELCFNSDEAFIEHSRAQSRRLFSGPLYRAAFTLFRPARVARLIPSTWALFHRGTTTQVVEHDANHVMFRVFSPPHLAPPLLAQAYLASGVEAVRLGGGNSVRGVVVSHGASAFEGRFEWD